GKKGFEILSAPDISAAFGGGGSWLIDPNNILIVAGGGNTNVNDTAPFVTGDDGASLGVDLILTALTMADSANVTITTGSGGGNAEDGDISLFTNIDYNGIGTGDSLTLIAPAGVNANGDATVGDITIRPNTEIHDSAGTDDNLSINLFASGDVLLNSNVTLETNGGNFTVGFVDQNTPTNNIIPTSFTNNGTISTAGRTGVSGKTEATDGGDININSSGSMSAGSLGANGGV
ncbi:MAG: hypothetical protein GY942_09660, partial [Aestuariibacter sp.]|nr:hypothetical protein [Aestuariibacter sp.]